jgi:radical SAM protein with 4Fe4S-binding SPASM domain
MMQIQAFPLWEKLTARRAPLSFDLELTARCNCNCRHCYINLPAADRAAQTKELSVAEIEDIAGQAVELGAVWCLLTGGEPLLRPDFSQIYLLLKRKGLLVSVFTNACLISEEHIALFKKYPPRDIEVTVYGATQAGYERVTRVPGSFTKFMHGLDLLLAGGVQVRLKAMALRSNLDEMEAINRFCQERTKDYSRFDPVLHLRFDGNPKRNAEIKAERLTPQEIVALERSDPRRFDALQRECTSMIAQPTINYDECQACKSQAGCMKYDNLTTLFSCGVGQGSFAVGYDGTYRSCSSLWAPGMTANLRQVSLRSAWEELTPSTRQMHTRDETLLRACKSCAILELCLWCPANAHLETGSLEGTTPYFCAVAHARAEAMQNFQPGAGDD